MRSIKWAAGLATVFLSAAPAAQVPIPAVTFSGIGDAVPNAYFNSALTAPDIVNGNRLVIGFNSGLDLETFSESEFSASTRPFGRAAAMDTIKFTVTAPEGYYIGTITYTQQGTGSVLRTGRASGAANWVVGDTAVNIGRFSTEPFLTSMVDVSASVLTSVPVSITSSLFAFSTPALGAAEVTLTSADVVVTLLSCDGPAMARALAPDPAAVRVCPAPAAVPLQP